MRLAVIDCETTGLPLHPSVPLYKQPKIIEFAARIVDDDGPTDESIEFLCNPEQQLEEIITKITGLTDDDLKGEKPFTAFIDVVQNFLDECDGMVAHNLPFDSFLIWLEIRRAKKESAWRWPAIQVCTSQAFESEYGFRPKLIKLYEDITGEPYKQTHRALDDVDALTEVVVKGGIIEHCKEFSSTQTENGIYIPEDICPG